MNVSNLPPVFIGLLFFLAWVSEISGQRFGPPTETRDFFVDAAGGLDTNDGLSVATPFRTINQATMQAKPGDVINVRKGVYREKVTFANSGTKTAPIVLRAYESESVVLSSGEPVLNWSRKAGNLWQANVDWGMGENNWADTLFVSGSLRYEARHHAENNLLDADDWGQLTKGSIQSDSDKIVLNDLRGFGDDYWNGAKIKFQTLDWVFVTRTIIDYVSETGEVILDQPAGKVELKQDNIYLIFGVDRVIDKPGEWFKSDANTLLYMAEPNQNPNQMEIEFKKRNYLIDISGKDFIHIKGMDFRGAAILADENSDHNLIQLNRFYAFGKGGVGRFRIHGDHNVVRENEFSHCWSSAIESSGKHTRIVNNFFHHTGLNPLAKVLDLKGSNMLVSYNTFRTFARSVLDGYPLRSDISFNLIEDAGRLSYDTGAFDSDGYNGNTSSSRFHHNILRNTRSRGIMEAFYGRNNNAVIDHNLVYNWQPSSNHPVSGFLGIDFRQVYHNTIISDSSPRGQSPDYFSNDPERITQTRYNNNLQISLDRMKVSGTDLRSNHNYHPKDFVDFQNNDFRLAAGSRAIDAGIVLRGINDGFRGASPDIGAVEFGEPLWSAGHDFSRRPSTEWNWSPLPGSNRFGNSQFSEGIQQWQVISGNPTCLDRNSWNLKNESLTGFFRTKSVEFLPGTSISKTFHGLKPDTVYTLGAAARIITDVGCADAVTDPPSDIQTGEYRGEKFVTNLNGMDHFVLENIDFGEPGQFDVVEFLFTPRRRAAPIFGSEIQLRLDGPDAELFARLSGPFEDGHYGWSRARAGFHAISGIHSVYVSIVGEHSRNLALSRMRLLKEQLPKEDKLKVAVKSKGVPETVAWVGWTDWNPGYQKFRFRTGPGADSATVTLTNEGRLNGYLDRLCLVEGLVPEGKNLVNYGCDASQSSSVRDAGLAVDGRLDTFSETQSDGQGSWFQVEIPVETSLGKIAITNRNDSFYKDLSNFYVAVFSDKPEQGGEVLWKKHFLKKGSLSQGGTLEITGDETDELNSIRLASARGKVVRVQLAGVNVAGNNRLSISNIALYSAADVKLNANLALQGKSTQSSNFYLRNGFAALAANGTVFPEGEFTSTKREESPWWQVRWDSPSSIEQIVIFNRKASASRIGDFRVTLWNEDPDKGGVELWRRKYRFDQNADSISRKNIGAGTALVIPGNSLSQGNSTDAVNLKDVKEARVLRIQKLRRGILSLSEVQVWQAN